MKKFFWDSLSAAAPRVSECGRTAGDYFSRLPVLETDSLLLRPMRRGDLLDLYAFSSDPEVARYVLWDPHASLSDTREYLRYIRRQYRAGFPSSWGIVLKESKKVIGTIGVMWLSEENRSAEIGYSLARPFWNRGLMTQALSAVLRSLFSELQLHRIEGQCDLRNPASGRVMEKCGMRREGVLRGRIRNKGEYIDTVLYAVLEQELPR